MFKKETYTSRRAQLKKLIKSGIIVLFGNNEAPVNGPANSYAPFRQDSSFLYYFGQKRDGLVGIIDIDEDKEILIGNDIDIEDIVWFGSVDAVKDLATQVGVDHAAPMAELKNICDKAQKAGRKIHFLPPYRHDIQIQILDLLGIHPYKQKEAASLELINAVVEMRSVKTEEEIAELEAAAEIGYKMHTTAMRIARPGVTEKFVAGQIEGIANSYGSMVSFPIIFSQHGEIMHGGPSMKELEDGRLVLCDCGAENMNHYCSDNTRTFPINGKFTSQQLDIYNAVVEAHDKALELSRPGITYKEVHFAACRVIFDRMKEIGLAKGNTDDALAAGAHAMFLPHGLGHMMGLDVHDMEALGQIYVGFDAETRPNLDQFGTNCLRMGRRLQEGFVVTDEPGIYFIPALIDEWRAKKHCADFLNFDKLDEYKNFGGIRIEDDILITKEGCRFLGKELIPYKANDVEDYIAKNR